MNGDKEKTSQEVEETVSKVIQPVRKDWYKDYDLNDPEVVRKLIHEIVGK